MNRTNIIQSIIDKIKAKKYLEIGIADGANFNKIECDYKISVDPNPVCSVTHKVESDVFFKTNLEKFDVIFIDGLHESDQVYKDIINSLEILENGGYIICHDMNPTKREMQEPFDINNSEWCGDCWKAWVKLRKENNNIYMYTVDTDYGCGIISKGHQDVINIDTDYSYESLEQNREIFLNLISVEEFKKMI